MDLISTKEFLKDDAGKIIELLNEVGFCHIKHNHKQKEIRCAEHEYGNPTAIKINTETLGCINYKSSKNGDIISLIQEFKKVSYRSALEYIIDYFNLDLIPHKKIQLPFGGFYKKIIPPTSLDQIELKTYPESILDEYCNNPNIRFFNDRIDLDIQKQFNIGYDISSLRITIPWRSAEGKLIGIIGRLNEDVINEDSPKYLALLPFIKSYSLYGFSENYQNLVGQTVWICEAEKSVMIAKGMNLNNVISVGSHSISAIQVQLIKSLMPKKIIVSFDEGIEKEKLIIECSKFKNSFLKYNIGYFNSSCLPKYSKMSLFDLDDNKKIMQLAKENIIWLEN